MPSLALSFHEVKFNPIQRDNQIWLTSSELAAALGYKSTDSVTKIYSRNVDEFTENMTQVIDISQNVNLTASNLVTKARAFSLRGCHLLAMFARTAIAKEFRKWVLDILDKEVGAPVRSEPKITDEQQQAVKAAVNAHHHRTGKHWQTIYHEFYDVFKIPRYQELPAVRFNDAMTWLNDGFVTKQTSALDQVLNLIYNVCFDAIKNNADGMEMLRVLRKLPFTDPDVNHFMLKQLWDANDNIQKLAETLNLRSRQGLPLMPNNHVLNMPNGGHISFCVQVRT